MTVRRVPSRSISSPVTRRPVGSVRRAMRARSGHHRDVRRLEGGRRDADLGIALGEDLAGEPIARLAADAGATLAQVDPERQRERPQALPFEAVGDVGDDRLMRDRRVGERRRTRPLDGVRAGGAVHPEQSLGFGVVGLELVVVDGPGRRDAVLALEHPEVLAPEARQGRAVDLRAAADDVVDRRTERLAAPVEVGIRRPVALGDEDLARAPVLGLARQVAAALDDEDLRAAVPERVGERPAAHAAADDRDVGRDRGRARRGRSWTAVPGRFEDAIERLDEEVVAPHDALVHAEPSTLVVDAMAQDPLPGRDRRWPGIRVTRAWSGSRARRVAIAGGALLDPRSGRRAATGRSAAIAAAENS